MNWTTKLKTWNKRQKQMRGLNSTSMKGVVTMPHRRWRTRRMWPRTRSSLSKRTILRLRPTRPHGPWLLSTRTTVRQGLPAPRRSKSKRSTNGGWSRTQPLAWPNPPTAIWTIVPPSTLTTRRPRSRERPNTQDRPTARWSSNTPTRRRPRSTDRLKLRFRSKPNRRCLTRSRRAAGASWPGLASGSMTSSLQTRRISRIRMRSWTPGRQTVPRWPQTTKKRAGVQMHPARRSRALAPRNRARRRDKATQTLMTIPVKNNLKM